MDTEERRLGRAQWKADRIAERKARRALGNAAPSKYKTWSYWSQVLDFVTGADRRNATGKYAPRGYKGWNVGGAGPSDQI